MRHFIPCRDTCTAEQLAGLFARHVFRLHRLPESIISDRGTHFTAKFWCARCNILGIELLLSTPFHPKTDGQTERMNAILEQYLRAYISYLQDDLKAWLHLAEFAGNNHETTGISPFASHAQDPLWQFDLSQASSSFTGRLPVPLEERDAKLLASKFKEITEHLQAEILWAQHKHQDQAVRKRKPATAFKVGDQVWFNAQNLTTQRPSRKLDHRRIGPYKITTLLLRDRIPNYCKAPPSAARLPPRPSRQRSPTSPA